jgi:hypothetical protein
MLFQLRIRLPDVNTYFCPTLTCFTGQSHCPKVPAARAMRYTHFEWNLNFAFTAILRSLIRLTTFRRNSYWRSPTQTIY